MKKKSSIFFALLFAATMAFSFGMASEAQARECCNYGIPMPGCTQAKGHEVEILPHIWICVKDYSNYCDLDSQCQ